MRDLAKILLATIFASLPVLSRADYSGCVSCHNPAVPTCNGCHSHGTHSSVAMDDINVAGTTDAGSYAPSATVTVTVTGGWQSGWVRVLLLDDNLEELARSSCPGGMGGCTTSVYPVTLTAPAPSTPGSHTWAVAWYGNETDKAGASFGDGTSSNLRVGYFTPDANNANHGYQVVALPSFSVDATSSNPGTSAGAPTGGCGSSGGAAGPIALLALVLVFWGRRLASRTVGEEMPSSASRAIRRRRSTDGVRGPPLRDA